MPEHTDGTSEGSLARWNPAESVLSRGGEMGALIRAFDWSKNPLGPVADWPQSLKTSVSICLASRFPIVLYWGPEFVVLYNDAYSQILGSKHPWALGQTCEVCWAEIWDTIGPMLNGVVNTGMATWSDDLLLRLRRFGYPEECYFSFSFSPVQVERGEVGGVFTAVIETTEKVIGERRLRTLRDLAARAVDAKTQADAWQIVANTVAENPADVPFAIFADWTGEVLRIAGTAGISDAHPLVARLSQPGSDLFQKAKQVIETGQRVEIQDLASFASELPCGAWETAPRTALLLPIASLGQGSTGVMLAAVSPAKQLDDSYSTFFDLLTRQISTSIADARAHEEERRRAESLAELDRAKTVFFSNISHELRTPLTLVLGPTEAALAEPGGALRDADLALVHRNELRLLKLVNTLLDFSRIEAGRIHAVYEPTDICALTIEIASVFRSAIEKAGLRFSVDCKPLAEPVYVDREMWEKIVMNLLSNAFKFTFEGEIALTLAPVDCHFELRVRDTGTGIPQQELSRVFERFHRIENARARTQEGTGIGLALVQELTRLHGGSARVESKPGHGSTFTVTIPTGTAHLPADRIQAPRTNSSTALSSEVFLDEVERWLPEDAVAVPGAESRSAATQDLIVVADDNADMREYLAHLLRDHYAVHVVGNGLEAVAATLRLRPSLVLTDVMMPELDGFGVLQAIRNDESLRSTPVILLSARAGEESRVEGLHAGADDYLVKPFTAKELLARVGTHLKMANLRREAAEREARLRAAAELERRRFQELLAQAPAGIGVLSGPDHRWTFVNDEYVRLTGRNTPADFIGKTLVESLPEIETRVFVGILDEVYRSGKSYFGREQKVHLNRAQKGLSNESYWDFVYQPIRDAEGNVEGILVHGVDVTEKVVAQEARRRLAAIVESSDDAIISKDLNGIVTSWNHQAERLFGYTEQEMIGRSILTIIPPELQRDEDSILARIRSGQKIDHFETVRVAKSGEKIEVSLSISPVRDEQGKIVGAAKIARDIRENKKIEHTLRTTEKLATAGRLAATVAHEINNPLEAVTNLVYLAQRELRNPEKVGSYLNLAKRELDRVAHIARQTLGFYRDTSSATRFNVSEVLDDLLALYERRLESRNIHTVRDYDKGAELEALPGEIRQAFSNLLSNAMDAMPAGGALKIRVRASQQWSKSQRRGIRITIADSGSGISLEHKRNLFQPFFTTKADIGTGLGLWITRGIVEKHGGAIQVKSSTGRNHGTTFSIFLPLSGKQAAQPTGMNAAAEGQMLTGVSRK